MFKKRCSKVQLDMSWIDCQISNLLELVSCQLISMSPVDFHCFHNLCLLIRLSRKTKKLEYQKYLLTLDLGWSNKLSCKISAFYLENRKSCGHLKFQQATNKMKKSLISKIEFYFKKLLFLPLKIDYKVNCKSSKTRNTRIWILAIFKLFALIKSLLKLQMAT